MSKKQPLLLPKFMARLILLSALLLSACAAPLKSTPLPTEHLARGINLVRSLPVQIPDKAVPFPHAQFVLIPTESALEVLSPVPFVADAVINSLHQSAADAYETKYVSIDPYRIARASLQNSALLGDPKSDVVLQPFAFVQECADDRYRVSLVYHLHTGEWVGRYVTHLPTTYGLAEYKSPTSQVLATLRGELVAAAEQLRALLDRGAKGDLKPSGVKADIGSLYLLGGKALGVLPTTLLYAKGADVIEEGPDHVIARLSGDMTNAATAGGLFFGVHYLRKDQLHTFKKLAGTP
jgi:hypothetical protein